MLNKEIIVKRLSLIKYLYQIGIEQSRQSETIASFSILSFHDSIEMFLKLLAEHKNIRSDKLNFLDYWTKVPSLTLKESMRNLNSRRVNIKHKGLLPSKSDIEISRVNATDFFEQNTLPEFGIDFKEISLLDLIQYEEVKKNLEIASESLENNNIEKCIEHSALAFDDLIHNYEKSKESYFGNSPFYFGKDLTFLSSFHIGIGNEFEGRTGRKLDDFIDRVKESLEGIQSAVKILSFGIDYKKFSKFKLLTPNVVRFIGGNRSAEIYGEKKWTKENCQFCIDFVIESSLKLQEFDFDINEIMDNTPPEIKIINKKAST
ncbi:hypothetical protein [Maribacter stanieri]|uniref:hypothetical protein n=1 Tax=Maribacter stanieri TaxID=440514 RepID=UPI0024947AF7|nr:hypothetical protein [Maribacter stanieri]